ncbi:MAG: prolyl oligopeptidase family serine peptidase [Pseudomonadota bacterium]
MSDSIQFPELESDAAAIRSFCDRETARTEAALCDAEYDADVERAVDALRTDDRLPVVVRRGAWLYTFTRDVAHPRGLWRRLPETEAPTPEAAWSTVLDLDAFCQDTGEDWHWRGAETAMFDAERLLVCLSFQGSDQWRYLEWDAAAGQPVPGGFDLGPERNRICWLDAETVLYGTSSLVPNSATRSGWPRRVVRVRRGMAPSEGDTVFEVGHEDLMSVSFTIPTPEGQSAVVHSRVRVIGDSEKVLHLDGADGPGVPLDTPRDTQSACSTTHYAYIASGAAPEPTGALVLCEVGGTERQILFTPGAYASVSADSIFLGHRWMLWVELDRMVPRLRALDLQVAGGVPVTLPLPDSAERVELTSHDAAPMGDGPWQLVTSGFLAPSTTWLFDLEAGPNAVQFRKLLAEPPSFDATGMEVRLHMAVSEDGTEVPYHIVLPAERAAVSNGEGAGPLPVLQYGYGGFGAAMSPAYLRLRGPLWLARGGAFVMAYIRGGGEFGKAWHEAAKGPDRPRAFEDFAAVAADLVARGYTIPERIGCHGGSNGGLLCSVMLTRYPERFGAVWASVSVTDMLRYHLFPAGAGWMDEYGDPDVPEERAWLLAYSPMHQVATAEAQPYPPALIDTNDSDDRVDPSHSRRFAAALLEAGQPAFFHSRAGGHGGGGALTEIAREQALGYAFLRHALGLR